MDWGYHSCHSIWLILYLQWNEQGLIFGESGIVFLVQRIFLVLTHWWYLLSPILFLTSDPTLIPPIFLFLIPIMFWLLISSPIPLSFYPLCSVPVRPYFIILSTPSCSLHATDNHVILFPHALISCVDSNLMLLYCSPHGSPISSSVLALFPKPPVFKHCISFGTNQSDYCVLLCILLCYLCSTTFNSSD